MPTGANSRGEPRMSPWKARADIVFGHGLRFWRPAVSLKRDPTSTCSSRIGIGVWPIGMRRKVAV